MKLTLIIIFIIISLISNMSNKKKKLVQTNKKKQLQNAKKQDNTMIDRDLLGKKMTPIEKELIARQEGSLSEDKSKAGSLTYVEVDAPDEGIQTESIMTDNLKRDESKKLMIDNSSSLGLTEMQYNIVMTEIIGLPRALKRNIR